MATHDTTCPACGSKLTIYVVPHLGGGVEENIGVALSAEGKDAKSVLKSAQKALAAAQAEAVAAAKQLLADAGGEG